MDAKTRAELRRALQALYPWVAGTEWGPAAVEAGECDACGTEARLVQVCGPGSQQFLGRRCVTVQGTQAWCSGHLQDAAAALTWVVGLPDETDLVARLWWVATGEVSVDPKLVSAGLAQLGLPG